jgi:intraflagellar transport protein 172
MFTDMGNFPEALRVAKKHAPHLVNELNNKYMNAATAYSMTGEDVYNSARTWEDSRDYLKAIDMYLDIKPDNT